jgi:opacity protein-like surface antigen
MMRFGLLTAILLFCTSNTMAQRHELGLLLGGMKASDKEISPPQSGSISTSFALTYQFNYARRLANAHLASLHLEFPFVGAPSRDITTSNVLVPNSYSSLFITPGIKLKLLPVAPLSPYGAFGVGIAHFSSSSTRVDGQPNTGSRGRTRAVYDFGAGVDMKFLPFISLRGELRDFISGLPNFNLPVSGNRQHNLLVSAGVVLRF